MSDLRTPIPDLAAIRESKGISLAAIARETKISRRYLEAIERADLAQLPGGLFTTSYLRQYARAIDFDEWDLVARCGAAIPPPPEEPPRKGMMGPLLRFFGAAKRA